MTDWPGWALKGLIAGAIGLLITILSEHSKQLRDISLILGPIQYDLKAISEKSAEQRDTLRSLSQQVESLKRVEKKK